MMTNPPLPMLYFLSMIAVSFLKRCSGLTNILATTPFTAGKIDYKCTITCEMILDFVGFFCVPTLENATFTQDWTTDSTPIAFETPWIVRRLKSVHIMVTS